MSPFPLENPEKQKEKARCARPGFEKVLKKLKARDKRALDRLFHELHHEVFKEINCLDCANCCRSISPIITDKDIERLARHLKIKPSEFVARYLETDEEDDHVFREQPCPFLGGDNYCMVYEKRPKACREYPHTDRPKMYQLIKLCLKNAAICPVVYKVLERMEKD
jgi:hypothetical protein